MLYEKINYTSDISYLNNVFVREYDISKANINILFTKGLIDKETYDYLYAAERMVRQVYVGKLIRDTKLLKELQSGIIEAKKMLFEANNIKDYEVLSIKNDAVYIINRRLTNTEFDLIKFNCKNEYTSYYRINNLEVYYYYNSMSKEEHIDIKGINDEVLKLHEGFMLQLLKDIFYTTQMHSVDNAIKMLKGFYNQYILLQLPVGYYRTFDNNSNYHYKTFTFAGTGFSVEHVSENDKDAIDISYNISILMNIQKILMSMYFSKNK